MLLLHGGAAAAGALWPSTCEHACLQAQLRILLTLRTPPHTLPCGCALQGVYKAVMARARQLGVVVVKAAGNSGDEGPFTADVSTA